MNGECYEDATMKLTITSLIPNSPKYKGESKNNNTVRIKHLCTQHGHKCKNKIRYEAKHCFRKVTFVEEPL